MCDPVDYIIHMDETPSDTSNGFRGLYRFISKRATPYTIIILLLLL